MKKLIQILSLLLIISMGQVSYAAGSNKNVKASDPAPQDTGTVRSFFLGVHPNVGGEMILVVTVLDLSNHPIQGATVSAPCTGLPNKLTDIHGVASFSMGTVCTCSEDLVTVTTTKGCYQQIHANCDKYTVICN